MVRGGSNETGGGEEEEDDVRLFLFLLFLSSLSPFCRLEKSTRFVRVVVKVGCVVPNGLEMLVLVVVKVVVLVGVAGVVVANGRFRLVVKHRRTLLRVLGVLVLHACGDLLMNFNFFWTARR